MYSEDDLNLLETIRCLKNTGMHVNDIGTFIALCREGDSTLEQRRQVMLEHKAQVEERIAQMMHELEHIERKLDYYDRACQAGSEQKIQAACCRVVRHDPCRCAPACGSDGNK